MKLEWYTQGGRGFSVNQWLPCKEVSHNVLLQQTELKIWSCLQLHGSITRRLIAATNELQEVINAMDTAGKEYTHLYMRTVGLTIIIIFIVFSLPAELQLRK